MKWIFIRGILKQYGLQPFPAKVIKVQNGLSYGKALNKDGDYALVSIKDHKIDKEKSRRVEFRIITTGDEVLENFVKKNSATTGSSATN